MKKMYLNKSADGAFVDNFNKYSFIVSFLTVLKLLEKPKSKTSI